MQYMAANMELNSSLDRLQKNCVRRILFYLVIGIAVLTLAMFLFIKFFSPLIAVGIVLLFLFIGFLIVEIIKSYRLHSLMGLLEELLDNGFYLHAYYLITTIKPHFRTKWIATLSENLRKLANISSDEELVFNNELYDKEIDNIISLIDFNIDIYKDFYLHNKLAVESYGKQLGRFDNSVSALNDIYEDQQRMLEVEETRLEAFEEIKRYFQNLKKEQIKQMFNVPQVLNLDKNYGRFINQLLDKAVYSAEARAILNQIFLAKSRFYEVFSDILKAKTTDEIKEKLNYLLSS